MNKMNRMIVGTLMAVAVGAFVGLSSGMAQAQPVAAKPATAGSAYIDRLGKDILGAIHDGTLIGPKSEIWFQQFIDTNFDVEKIARFSLGRYWRVATPTQQQEYLTLFRDMIVKVYGRRFRDYSGETFTVTNEQALGDKDILVTTMIQPQGKPPISTQWRIRAQDQGGYKVIDLLIENISMAVTQRAEFASIIEQNGGQVEALLNSLRQRIASSAQ